MPVAVTMSSGVAAGITWGLIIAAMTAYSRAPYGRTCDRLSLSERGIVVEGGTVRDEVIPWETITAIECSRHLAISVGAAVAIHFEAEHGVAVVRAFGQESLAEVSQFLASCATHTPRSATPGDLRLGPRASLSDPRIVQAALREIALDAAAGMLVLVLACQPWQAAVAIVAPLIRVAVEAGLSLDLRRTVYERTGAKWTRVRGEERTLIDRVPRTLAAWSDALGDDGRRP